MGEKAGYYLIACGTSRYNNLDDNQQLPCVETELTRVVNLFTEHFGYKQVLTELQVNPKKDELTRKFADWLQHDERQNKDTVIFYYSGHGEYYKNDRHYLLLEDTDPNKVPQTSLPTEDLVRPLNNEGVKISQILYIIDTCYSGVGTGDITKFGLEVIQKYQPVSRENKAIAVHSIAVTRAKNTAQPDVFSTALEKVIQDWKTNSYEVNIYPEKIVDKINKIVPTQIASYKNSGSETSATFFPIVSKNLQTWEERKTYAVNNLWDILRSKIDSSLYFVNSFLLERNLCERFLLNEQNLLEQLNEFSTQPILEEICPLIACSEWCWLRFNNQSDKRKYNPTLAQKIKNWQSEIIGYREGVNLNKINNSIVNSFNKFKNKLRNETPRLQLEIQPELDKNNSGNFSGFFIVNMNLWIQSKNWILARFPEQLRLELEGIEQTGSNKSQVLLISLNRERCLSDLIRIVRYSLSDSLDTSINLDIEFFLPFEFLEIPLETILFKYGQFEKALGKEYQIYINSWERYFDKDYVEIAEKINVKKRLLWGKARENPKSLSDNDLNNLERDIETLLERFDACDIYLGTSPSKSILKMVDATLPIAIWSRNVNKPLVECKLNILKWEDFPRQVHQLRQNIKDPEVTLFWDDLYSKPSERLQPLNTEVVE
ncbi:caspase family protein [Aetokthonos hydrillicola Thurmond2011]|jgi:hypothetical protein|uniref:Caspase family protein n=1 Tax=Aetokthonos hydrillicola Thurmond2011 TaxID=2712845 RepID=A0AAP5IG56_9CYAN|nr:caspase family protein [Aetokthonos hydrillicola]MBW4585226.1 caspase family protein [Aetokthonos hydrillicola CCALA 1050]MDR9899562.1 caspase family protein [Aetokthonos hydrillicola Thurmond2011]